MFAFQHACVSDIEHRELMPTWCLIGSTAQRNVAMVTFGTTSARVGYGGRLWTSIRMEYVPAGYEVRSHRIACQVLFWVIEPPLQKTAHLRAVTMLFGTRP